ncbi:MAG TPA: VanZ family protein, partial [Candidatus Glassbacteria bacterium]|nr:VanZ family protein [Candidatus Glassbacteria bacterium]
GPGRYWSAFAMAALFGVLDELHQSFVPGRMMDWRDFIADSLGALIFIQIWAATKKEGFVSAPPEVENE